MRYLTVEDVLDLQRRVLAVAGGLAGVRDLGVVEAAVAQPRMSFGGQEQVILSLAAGAMNRESFAAWVASHVQPIG
ncbi:MAG: hypothetical protein ACKV2Q_04855 [Planctomycetaceae bacterium]